MLFNTTPWVREYIDHFSEARDEGATVPVEDPQSGAAVVVVVVLRLFVVAAEALGDKFCSEVTVVLVWCRG